MTALLGRINTGFCWADMTLIGMVPVVFKLLDETAVLEYISNHAFGIQGMVKYLYAHVPLRFTLSRLTGPIVTRASWCMHMQWPPCCTPLVAVPCWP